MRLLLLTAGFFVCIVTQAQVRIGVQAGINRVNWSATDAHPTSSGETYSTSGASNLHGGIVGQVHLSHRWHLRSGLFLTGKGTTLDHHSDRDTSSLYIWVSYIELPITLVYQGKVGKNMDGFAGAGLYGAYGLYGAAIGEGVDKYLGPYGMERWGEFGWNNENQLFPPVISPIDYGYILLAGLQRHRMQLLLSYSQGCQTLLNPRLFYDSFKNRVLSLSVAYLVPTNRKKKFFR